MKAFKIMFLVCIAVMLMVPLGFTTWKPEIISKLDNRMLSKLPQAINEWRIHGEDVLRDRIGLRENRILFYRQAVCRLFHILDHPLYKNGDNGHNYYCCIMALNAYQSFYSNSDTERIVSRLDGLHQYLKSQGKPFLFVHIPLKQNLSPEFTPDSIKKA